MPKYIVLPLLAAVLLGCGGSSGVAPGATLRGQLAVLAGAELQSDREPNDTLASARLARAEPAGSLDPAAGDALDVFRYVAYRAGVFGAEVRSEGLEAEVLLHDLATGRAGRRLRLERGAVYDVVVHARAGSGRYVVDLREEEGEPQDAALPPRYLGDADACVAGEIVVGLRAGIDACALCEATGLELRRAGSDLCLLVDPDGAACRDACASLRRVAMRGAQVVADGWARFAEPNFVRRLTGLPDDPLLSAQWALEAIHAPEAWTRETGGAGIVVAVVDSGIRSDHPDMAGRVITGYDFVDNDTDPTDTATLDAHGTSVASIIAAATNNAEGIAGINWDARILAVRAFDAAGESTTYRIAQAIRYAAGLGNDSGMLPTGRARVINLSFASASTSAAEEDACAAARAAGALLVAAAGNEGDTTPQYPAALPTVLAVTATNRSGALAGYASFGDWLDLAAPGGDVGSRIYVAGMEGLGQLGYERVSGTSFAAPHVSGVAALVLSAVDMDPVELAALLRATARDAGAPGYDTSFGHGIVDAYAAVMTALDLPPPPLLPLEELVVRARRLPDLAIEAAVKTTEAEALAWTLTGIPAGRYMLEAGTDRDLDGILDEAGELFGRWRDGEAVEVESGEVLEGLDFALTPVSG